MTHSPLANSTKPWRTCSIAFSGSTAASTVSWSNAGISGTERTVAFRAHGAERQAAAGTTADRDPPVGGLRGGGGGDRRGNRAVPGGLLAQARAAGAPGEAMS